MRYERLKVFSFYLFLSVLLFFPVLFSKRTFVPADYIDRYLFYPPENKKAYGLARWDGLFYTYPTDAFYGRELKKGNFPFWNPYVFSGYPVFANGQSEFLNPLKMLLYTFLPPYKARDIFVFIYFSLSGFFMFLFLREIGISFLPSIIGGLLYQFNIKMTAYIHDDLFTSIYANLPLLLFCFEKAIKRGIFWTGAGGAVFGLLLLGRYLPASFYSTVIFLAFSIFRVMERRNYGHFLKAFLKFILILFTGFLISALQLIPTLEMINLAEEQKELEDITGRSFPSSFRFDLIAMNFFSPLIFGWGTDMSLHFRIPFDPFIISAYGGISSAFLLFSGAWRRGDKPGRFFLIFFAVIFISYLLTPINNIISLVFPFFKKLNPLRTLSFPLAFLLSVLAGIGAESFLMNPSLKRKYLSLLLLSIFSLGSAGLSLYFHKEEIPINWASPQNIRIYIPLIVLILLASLSFLKISSFTKGLLLIILSLCELFPIAKAFNRPVPSSLLRSIEFPLKDGFYRVSGLEPNLSSLLGIYSPDGFEALIPDYYHTGTKVFPDPVPFRFARTTTLSSLNYNLMRVLGVKYLISSSPPSNIPPDKIEKVMDYGVLSVYEMKDALPRVFIVGSSKIIPDWKEASQMVKDGYEPLEGVIIEEESGCSGGQGWAEITGYETERVVIDAVVSGGCGFLVLSDTYYPGWRAFVDGKERKIFRAYGFLRAVEVDEGHHRVEFRFEPGWVGYGVFLSGSGILVTLLLMVMGFKSLKCEKKQEAQELKFSIDYKALPFLPFILFLSLKWHGYIDYIEKLSSSRWHTQVADLYLLKGEEGRFFEELKEALKEEIIYPEAYLKMGLHLLKEERFLESIENLGMAFQFYPSDTEICYGLSRAYHGIGNLPRAIEWAEYCLKLWKCRFFVRGNPPQWSIRCMRLKRERNFALFLSTLYIKSGNGEKALSLLRDFASEDDPDAFLLYALALMSSGRNQEAREIFEELLNSPSVPEGLKDKIKNLSTGLK